MVKKWLSIVEEEAVAWLVHVPVVTEPTKLLTSCLARHQIDSTNNQTRLLVLLTSCLIRHQIHQTAQKTHTQKHNTNHEDNILSFNPTCQIRFQQYDRGHSHHQHTYRYHPTYTHGAKDAMYVWPALTMWLRSPSHVPNTSSSCSSCTP